MKFSLYRGSDGHGGAPAVGGDGAQLGTAQALSASGENSAGSVSTGGSNIHKSA